MVLQRVGPEANALRSSQHRAEAGDPPEAIELYERARSIMPTHIHVLVNLASLYRATGRMQEARQTLDAALRVDPRFAIAHNNLGNVSSIWVNARSAAFLRACSRPRSTLRRSGRRPGRDCRRTAPTGLARGLAERALQLAPQNVPSGLTLACVMVRQDDAEEATAILEGLLGSDTLSVTNRILAQGTLGDAYDRLGQYREAFAAFTRANALQHEQCAAIIAQDRGPLTPASIARLRPLLPESISTSGGPRHCQHRLQCFSWDSRALARRCSTRSWLPTRRSRRWKSAIP